MYGFLCLNNSLFSLKTETYSEEKGMGLKGKGSVIGNWNWKNPRNGKRPRRQKEKERENDKAGRSSRCLAGLKKPDVDKEELNRSASCIHVANRNYKAWQPSLPPPLPVLPAVPARCFCKGCGGFRCPRQLGGALGTSENQKPAGPVVCSEWAVAGRV